MKRILLTAAMTCGLVWLGTPASAQERTEMATRTFESVDADGNGEISKDEFYGTVRDIGIYPAYDANSDNRLDETELVVITFDDDFVDEFEWDADQDGFVNEDEFFDGVFTGFDKDESGHWDGDEWDDAGEAGLWDF